MIFDPAKKYGIIVFDNSFQFEDWQVAFPEREIAQVETIPVNVLRGDSFKLCFHFAVTFVRGSKESVDICT